MEWQAKNSVVDEEREISSPPQFQQGDIIDTHHTRDVHHQKQNKHNHRANLLKLVMETGYQNLPHPCSNIRF